MPSPAQRLRSAAALAVLAIAVCAGRGVRAATFHALSWSADAYTATGTLALDDAVGVGESFTTADVAAFDVELFVGGTPVASLSFPPFSPGFDTIEGTREVAGLRVTDLFVSGPGGVLFGCEGTACLSASVWFDTPASPDALVEFPSIEAARASFVFTEVPEPHAAAAVVAALGALVVMRARRGA